MFKVVILLGFLVLFVFAKRPFCRFVCPMGLIFSFFNRISVLQLKVAATCDHCDACQKNCPVDHKVYEDPNSPECVRCLQCTACKHVQITAPLLHPRLPHELVRTKETFDGFCDHKERKKKHLIEHETF
ncbi:4Fe-4S binding protein [Planctomycetota bacterium]